MTPDEVLQRIENDPEGFMIIGPEKGKILTDLIDKYQPKHILEVGTNLGYSSILMATHLPKGGKITTLELSQKTADKAQGNIKDAGFENIIEIVVGDAKETILTLNNTYDFVFIDAAKKQYLTYLQLLEDKLAPKVVIVADNVGRFKQEVTPYLEYVKEKYESKTQEIGNDAIEISIR